jgi:hypothetical protein
MQALTQTSYRLLAHPEYIEPLRQEIEAVVAKEGWTKAGMDKMHKMTVSFGKACESIVNFSVRQTPLSFYSISLHSY